jgi:hypothetical protein
MGLVPLAKRGNRLAPFLGSPREAGQPSCALSRFPSRSGGNLQEGGNFTAQHSVNILIRNQRHEVDERLRQHHLTQDGRGVVQSIGSVAVADADALQLLCQHLLE